MSEVSLKRKLDDLRVVDLRSELEKRGLDKNGVKATLMDRLKQAIENEGGDAKTFEFILSTSTAVDSPAKRSKRKHGSIKAGDVDGEDEEEDHAFESLADLVQENGDPREVGQEVGEAQLEKVDAACDDKFYESSAEHQQQQQQQNDDDQVETLTIDDSDDNQERGGDKEGVGDTKQSVVDSTPANFDQSPMEVGDDDDQEIPNPEQVEPPCMFTAEDTIRLHEATLEDKARRLLLAADKNSVGGGSVGEPVTDEASSMYVNADESMSELNSVTTTNNNVTQNKPKEDDHSVDSVSNQLTHENEPNTAVQGQGSTKTTADVVVPSDTKEQVNGQTTTLKTDAENKKEPAAESQSELPAIVETKPAKEEPKKTEQKNPECCLWVSGIPSTIKAADLKSLFSKHGRVISAKVVKIKSKGAVQWYGNITMNSAEEASKCITNLHRTEVHGKSISIERGDGSYPPKRLTAAGALNAAAKAATPGAADQEKTVEEPSVEPKTEVGTESSATKQGASSVKGKKSPSSEDKKKPESVKGDKTKDKDKREPSKSRSDRATRRSSKERKPYRDGGFHSNRAARAVVNVARRRIITGRGPPPPPPPSSSYRGMRGGPIRRGLPPPHRAAPPPPRSSYRGSSRGGGPPPYRSSAGPSQFMPPVDFRRQRESEMMERMKYREMEHRQREEKLLIQREKERIRFERERLEREKLELQQVRMQAAYERSAALASTQQMMAAGVKRAYEGLDPYGSQEPDMKRANYGTPSGMAAPGSAGGRSSSRRSPPRSYRGRTSGGGGGDSYRSGGGGRTGDMSSGSGSRYDSSRSSRDTRPSNGGASSSSGGGGGYRSSSRRSDLPTTPVSRSSRGSRYSSPPPPRRSGGSGPAPPPLMGSSSHGTPRSSWTGGGSGSRQDDSMIYRGSGSSMGMVASGSSGVSQMRNWQSGSSTTPNSQWRSMASAPMHAQQSSGMGVMYGMTSQSNSYPTSEGRFNAYDYTASSTRRY